MFAFHWVTTETRLPEFGSFFLRQILGCHSSSNVTALLKSSYNSLIKRPARDAYLCIGDLQAPPAPHFVFLITL